MEQQYIKQTVKEFFQKLDDIHDELKCFSIKIDNKRDDIFSLLNDFRNKSDELKSKYIAKDGQLMNITNDIQNSITDWYRQTEKLKKSINFMRTHEKYLVVMVFGAVKAGKSTLGNFFAGKDFVNAKFDNEYKHREHPIFEMKEKGRNTGDIELDKNGQYWFSEGVTDTTGAIQYFTLSGLRWMDSPGTGSLEKEEDIRNMEEMVNEYIPYADMCIFLMNSSEPGLMEDMKYIRKLSREEQEAIIVITKSDKVEEDIDEKGNFIDKWMPKSAEIRKRQENDICERLQKKYPDIRADKFRAISVSTYLANLAIENEDVDLYKDSNLDKLMAILGDKISENVIELKEKKPKQNLNNFIDDIINGEETFKGIKNLKQKLEKYLLFIKDYKSKVELKIKRTETIINLKIENEIQRKSHQWVDSVNRTKQSLDDIVLSKEIMKIIKHIFENEINTMMLEFGSFYSINDFEFNNKVFNVGGITKQYSYEKEIYYETYYEYEPEKRKPYIVYVVAPPIRYKKVKKTRPRERIIKIDIGTNIFSYLDKLMPEIEFFIEEKMNKILKDKLHDISLEKMYVKEIQKLLLKLEIDLLNMKEF